MKVLTVTHHTPHLVVHVHRRQRSARFHEEWYSLNGVRWLHVAVGHPTIHRWWAFTLDIYITH